MSALDPELTWYSSSLVFSVWAFSRQGNLPTQEVISPAGDNFTLGDIQWEDHYLLLSGFPRRPGLCDHVVWVCERASVCVCLSVPLTTLAHCRQTWNSGRHSRSDDFLQISWKSLAGWRTEMVLLTSLRWILVNMTFIGWQDSTCMQAIRKQISAAHRKAHFQSGTLDLLRSRRTDKTK